MTDVDEFASQLITFLRDDAASPIEEYRQNGWKVFEATLDLIILMLNEDMSLQSIIMTLESLPQHDRQPWLGRLVCSCLFRDCKGASWHQQQALGFFHQAKQVRQAILRERLETREFDTDFLVLREQLTDIQLVIDEHLAFVPKHLEQQILWDLNQPVYAL